MGEDNGDILSDEHAVEQAKEYLRQGDTVEFFEKIASYLLKVQPDYPVEFCLKFVEKKLSEQDAGVEAEAEEIKAANANRNDDSKYMKKHNVSDFLDKWILALIAEKCGAHESDITKANTERLQFHKRYLEKLVGK
eukprot:TRINITY_DN4589_c1_g1_i1.p1 TRINITY_DN4589_c1_g1~~TRINITY_DN4589_c1_g1_i1.p1  ORF type:complete len:150 (+),score=37.48 TRINITY_DN4589_c1_g1_i1:44-451(+)